MADARRGALALVAALDLVLGPAPAARRRWRAACRRRSRSACASTSRCASPTRRAGGCAASCTTTTRPASRPRACRARSSLAPLEWTEVVYQARPVARGETRFGATELRVVLAAGAVAGHAEPYGDESAGARLPELPRAGEVHAARHRQPPVADRRAAGAPPRRGHGIPPAARVPPGRLAARHRLEGDLAHRAPDLARVRGREGPARAAGGRLRPAHGVEGRRRCRTSTTR